MAAARLLLAALKLPSVEPGSKPQSRSASWRLATSVPWAVSAYGMPAPRAAAHVAPHDREVGRNAVDLLQSRFPALVADVRGVGLFIGLELRRKKRGNGWTW